MSLTAIVCWLGALLGMTGSFPVIEDNQPKTVVVVPAGSPKKLVQAVAEFNADLRTAFKTELLVVQSRPKDGSAITFELKKAGVLSDDDFEISFPDDDTMRISCTELSSVWALRHLLENYAGVRWVMPAATGCGLAFSGRSGWEVPRRTVKDGSPFKFMRSLYLSPGEWQEKNGRKYSIRNDHGLVDVAFPAERYAKDNSWPVGMLPVVNGKKQIPKAKNPGQYDNYRGFWQPCFTNPESVKEAVKNICAHFERNPNAHDVSLGVNDCGGFCECPGCRKLVKPSRFSNLPSQSNAYFNWCNQVVGEVAKKYPDKYFGCMAYRETMDPPDFKLHPNLVPNMTIDLYAATDPTVKANRMAAIKEWGEKAAHTTFFEYSDPYCLPRLFFPLQEEMFRFMGANKVAGMFVESAPTLGEGPKLYLYMKQMWNPDVDAAAVVDEWCEATVGAKAAPYLEEYLDFWEKFWRREVPKTAWFQNSKDNVYMTFGFGGYMYALKDGDMAECRKLMERMVEAAGTPDEKKRAELLMAFFELYEANAVASVAELIPVGAQAESEEQAVAILRAIPRACEYLKKRDAIIDRLCVLYPYLARPDFKSGLYYHADPFTDGIITAVTPFAKCPSVAAELAKLAADSAVSPGLRGQALVFLKLATDPASLKNLLENGSFEGPAIPWACSFAHARSPLFAADGKFSLEVVQQDSRVVLHAFVPAKPDTDYMFVAKVFVPRGQVSVEAYVEAAAFLWKGDAPLQWYIPPQVKLVPGEWNLVKAFVPGAKLATRLEIFVAMNKFEKNDLVYIDDMMLLEIGK